MPLAGWPPVDAASMQPQEAAAPAAKEEKQSKREKLKASMGEVVRNPW